ncbi:GSCFA domain-containing protein [Actinomadura fibrosa]
MLGSCFVENIGKKLEYFKFQNKLNPFGILFHPSAIRNFLEKVSQKHHFSEEDIFYFNETWHSYQAHSDLNSSQKEEILSRLNSAVSESFEFLKTATHVVITSGTAWGYRLKETGKTVANCHKVPQKNFSKELQEVKEDLLKCVQIIREMNPSAAVIFTVSPVRHLKDGHIENQVSKAKLIQAVYEITLKEEKVEYFPSYEIMMDELRDYRFYSEDMLHPNQTAIDYIWEKFSESWISSEAAGTMKKIDGIQKGLLHRPFNPASEAHQKFTRELQEKIAALQEKHPHMKF